jgi:hypothetical protein
MDIDPTPISENYGPEALRDEALPEVDSSAHVALTRATGDHGPHGRQARGIDVGARRFPDRQGRRRPIQIDAAGSPPS